MKEKFSILVVTSTAFIFWGLNRLFEKILLIKQFPLIEQFPILKAVLSAISAGVFSFAAYKLLISIINFSGNRIEFIKEKLLGNEYLNGTWIGYFTGFSGKIRYVIDRIEQDFTGITIRGVSYDENLNFHSTWISEAVNIDGKKGKLTCTYHTSGATSAGDEAIGMMVYTFTRNKSTEAPYAVKAFSTDLHLGKRIITYEEKVKEKDLSEESLLIRAKVLYEERRKPEQCRDTHQNKRIMGVVVWEEQSRPSCGDNQTGNTEGRPQIGDNQSGNGEVQR